MPSDSDRYPILVKRLAGDRALTIVCQRCHTEEVIHPDDLLNEGLYMCPADAGRPALERCGGAAIMKYEEADECKGCGKLGFWGPNVHGGDPLKGCCSRRCMLQAEYLRELRGGGLRAV